MSASPDTLIDGNWTQPDTTGAPRFVYPFRLNGDKVSCYFEQDYLQRMASASLPFYPSPLSIPHPTLQDFYLIKETDPQFGIANLLALTRTYSRIPTTQVTYSSQAITKPNPSTFGINGGSVSTNAGAFVGSSIFYLNYYFVANQVFGPVQTMSAADSGANWRITTVAAHGILGTESIMASTNSGILRRFLTGQYTVVDANNIDVLSENYGTVASGSLMDYLRAFTPGVDRVGVKLSQTFYLPGVTAGITTPADIPIPSPLLNDLELVNSMLANLTGYQTYDSTALVQWMGSPIYTQTAIQINMADL